jgi:hypothetical protein
MRAFCLLPVFGLLTTDCYAQTAPITLVHEFHVTESGGFSKTLKELGSGEAAAIVTAACAAFGADCSQNAPAEGMAANVISEKYTSRGSNYFITGRLTKSHDGGEWRGLFDELDGYQVCKVALTSMNLSQGSTFNTSIFRSGQYRGLAFYAVVPRNRPEPQYIDAVFSIYYVPTGTSDQYDCAADGSHPW